MTQNKNWMNNDADLVKKEILAQSTALTPQDGYFAAYGVKNADGDWVEVGVTEDAFAEAMGWETIDSYVDEYEEFLDTPAGEEVLKEIARKLCGPQKK